MTILIQWCQKHDVERVAMGHHGTDTVSSMLKSYYMYEDRWQLGHRVYSHNNFEDLILSKKKIFTQDLNAFKKSKDCQNIKELAQLGKIGTDEPVIQILSGSNVKLYRPMHWILKRNIQRYFTHSGVVFNQTECFYTGYRSPGEMTSRELIQNELLSLASDELTLYLLGICDQGLDPNGYLRFNARNMRATLLGKQYKGGNSNSLKL